MTKGNIVTCCTKQSLHCPALSVAPCLHIHSAGNLFGSDRVIERGDQYFHPHAYVFSAYNAHILHNPKFRNLEPRE